MGIIPIFCVLEPMKYTHNKAMSNINNLCMQKSLSWNRMLTLLLHKSLFFISFFAFLFVYECEKLNYKQQFKQKKICESPNKNIKDMKIYQLCRIDFSRLQINCFLILIMYILSVEREKILFANFRKLKTK